MFCLVSSDLKKWISERKKPPKQKIFAHQIALACKSFRFVSVSTEYKLLMQISMLTRHALNLNLRMLNKCNVTLELYGIITSKDMYAIMLGLVEALIDWSGKLVTRLTIK